MTNSPAKFTQVDVRRALKAARAVDPDLTVQILPDGSLILVKGPDHKHEAPLASRPDYDF